MWQWKVNSLNEIDYGSTYKHLKRHKMSMRGNQWCFTHSVTTC